MKTHRLPTLGRIVSKAYRDSDGYWIELKPGWCMDDGTHGWVEDSRRDCESMVRNNARPCECAECLDLIAKGKR